MNKTIRNFWLDVFLFLLLGMDVILVILTPRPLAGMHPGFGWHAHAAISALLTFSCLMHVGMHWRCFHAAFTGKTKSKGKFMMQGLVILMMILAAISGHNAGGLHQVTGTLALIGLCVHGIKHVRWMVLTSKRLTSGQRQLEQG